MDTEQEVFELVLPKGVWNNFLEKEGKADDTSDYTETENYSDEEEKMYFKEQNRLQSDMAKGMAKATPYPSSPTAPDKRLDLLNSDRMINIRGGPAMDDTHFANKTVPEVHLQIPVKQINDASKSGGVTYHEGFIHQLRPDLKKRMSAETVYITRPAYFREMEKYAKKTPRYEAVSRTPEQISAAAKMWEMSAGDQ
jgi:hypothetical protein